MRIVRFLLRLYIAVTSVFSFLVGWILFAHSPKPVSAAPAAAAAEVTPMPTLAPLPPLDLSGSSLGDNSGSLPQFSVQSPPVGMFQPRSFFSTGGS